MGSKSGIQTISESVKILALSLVAILCVCPFSGQINDAQITGKWIYAGMAFFSMVIIVLIIDAFACTDVGANSDCTITFAIPFMLSGLVVTIHALLQITGFVTARNANGYNVLAGFDNPAGVASALSVSLPFVLALVDRVKSKWTKVAILVLIFCVVIMILSIARSRVGLLAAGAVLIMYVGYRVKDVRARWASSAILIIIVLTAVVYMSFLKRGSNSGRALILGVCWDMFKDAPLFGHGLHGFRSQYMLYQADYLDGCNSSVLPMLADNTTHPLNEYALVVVNFGLLGLCILVAGIIMTVRHYLASPNEKSYYGIMVLTVIGVLSLFSYPFRYPLTLLGLLYSLLLVYSDVITGLGYKALNLSRILLSALSCAGLVLLIIWSYSQIQWGKISAICDSGGNTNEVLEGYLRLYPKLKRDPYFLYNYAYVLSENGECEKAGNMASKSFDLMANYDTALLIADNAKECGDIDVAEEYYWLASRMCPVRFMPLYCLFCLYKDLDRIEDMREIGKAILSKPVKISSNEIRIIRSHVKQTLINNH